MNATEARERANSVVQERQREREELERRLREEADAAYSIYRDSNFSFVRADMDRQIETAVRTGSFVATAAESYKGQKEWVHRVRLYHEVAESLRAEGYVADVNETSTMGGPGTISMQVRWDAEDEPAERP